MAVLGHHHEVLDPHPETSLQVHTGFHGEHHPFLQLAVVLAGDVGWLVDVQADAVAGAVEKAVAVPRVGNNIAGGTVHRPGGNAGFDRLDGSLLGLADDAVNLAEPVGWVTPDVRAGLVAGVAVHPAAEVQNDRVAPLYPSVVVSVVGVGAVGSRPDDGLEGGRRTPRLAESALDIPCEVALGVARRVGLADRLADGVRGRSDPSQAVEFGVVLPQAEFAEHLPCEVQRRVGHRRPEVAGEPRPHPLVDEDPPGVTQTQVADGLTHRLTGVVVVAPDAEVVEVGLGTQLVGVQFGHHQRAVVGGEKEQEVTLARVVVEPGEVGEVRPREQHDRVGVAVGDPALTVPDPALVGGVVHARPALAAD